MRKICQEIDLHIVAILILFLPWPFLLLLFSLRETALFALVIPLLLPQGRIFTRFFWDYPAMGQARVRFLLVNECLVLGSVAAVVGLVFFLWLLKSISPV
jgi:hypothetical protein